MFSSAPRLARVAARAASRSGAARQAHLSHARRAFSTSSYGSASKQALAPLLFAVGAGSAIATFVALSNNYAHSASSGSQKDNKDVQKQNPKEEKKNAEDKDDKKKDTVEAKVAHFDDLKDGEMKEVQVGETKALLARVGGTYYATGLKCTHFGAPLDKGVLAGDQVLCPWHAASFSVKTGQVEGAPALDGLPTYKVRVDGADVYVSVPAGAPADRVQLTRKGHACACSEGDRVYVVVGGGPAGLIAAQTIRQDGFKGRVVLVTKEDDLPYDRTMLSKAVGTPKQKLFLRDEAFYKTHDIDVFRGMEVSEVDADKNKITFADGSTLAYTQLLLATGSNPFVLNVPGNGLGNVYALRNLEDSNSISESVQGAKNKKAVVIGASFIGLEAAACLRKNKGMDVTVVGIEQVPFEKILGPSVGVAFRHLHEENGVKFQLGRTVKEITGNGVADGVVLDDGTKIDADVVIMGVGVRPVTGYLKGVARDKDGGVQVDSHLRVKSHRNIFAAGDVARFPYAHGSGEGIRIEHWNVAQDTGRVAGHNMAGQAVEYTGVPFFWTNQFGVGLRYAGYSTDHDDIHIEGDVKGRKFIAYYLKGDKVQAVAAMGRDPVVPAAQKLFELDAMPSAAEVRKSPVDLVKRVRDVTTK